MDKTDIITARDIMALCDSRATICIKQLNDIAKTLAVLADGITDVLELIEDICKDVEK